jgi:RecB family exonuclease
MDTFQAMQIDQATPTLFPALVRELERATRAHPYERKLLVGARPAEGRELLRSLSLAGRAWVGWEPCSLRQLAHGVVAMELARRGLRTADPFDVMALVDRAIDRAESAGRTPAFPGGVPGTYRDPIRRTVEALRLAGLSGAAVSARAGQDPKLGMLAAILSSYEAGLEEAKLVDGPGILALAAEALEGAGGSPEAPGGSMEGAALPTDPVFLLPGLAMRGVQGRLIRALLGRGATVLATDDQVGLEAPAGRLRAASSGTGGPLARLHGVSMRAVDGGSPGNDAAGPDGSPGQGAAGSGRSPGEGAADPGGPTIELFAAATPADELREVLRRVVAAEIPWDRVEIVATDVATYGAALDALARRLGIPVTHSAGLPLSRTRVGRAMDAYFRWIADDFVVDPIRRLLANGDLAPERAAKEPDGDPAAAATPVGPSPAALGRRLRRLRIGWGYDRYLRTLDRALAALARTGPPRDGDGDDEAARAAMAREEAELRALKELLAPILAATPRPAGHRIGRTDRTSPAALAGGLLALLERVPAGDEVENTARWVLVQRLERARATLTRETSWMAATGILRSRLETRIAATATGGRLSPWTSTGGSLHLSDLVMGGLAARPHTFVVGLAAGAAGGPSLDPLLSDADRARLNGAAPGGGSGGAGPGALALVPERIEEGRYDLAATLARLRGNVTLSFAAWDMTEGRTIGPAPELLQALRLRETDPTLTYEDLRNRLAGLACAVPSADPDGAAVAPLDAADVWLEALATGRGPLRDGRSAVRALHPGLDHGLTADDVRRGDRLTSYHGLLRPDPSLDPTAGDAVLSASRLETLGKCPLQYFYRYALGIQPLRDPAFDPERWLDPLERGSLLHSVYERALASLPGDLDYDDDRFAEHALAILEQEVERTLHRLPSPNEAVLRAEMEGLAADVRSFVAMLRGQRPRVVRTELAFGPDPDAEGEVVVAVGTGEAAGGGQGGARLRLRGRVDRLDVLDDGRLRVVDYKTGRAFGYRQAFPFEGGRRLQHFLYALAVEALRPGEQVATSEYHFPTVRGENRVAGYDRAALEPGHQVVGTLVELAREGRFVATNQRDDCRFCDFREVCRVRQGGYGKVISPRADWAETHGSALSEYGPLLRLRHKHGSEA